MKEIIENSGPLVVIVLAIFAPIAAYLIAGKIKAITINNLTGKVSKKYQLSVEESGKLNKNYLTSGYSYMLSGNFSNSNNPFTLTCRSKEYEIESGLGGYSSSGGGSINRHEFFIDIALDKITPNTYILARYNLRRLLRAEYNIFSRTSRIKLGFPYDYFFECYTLDQHKTYIQSIIQSKLKPFLKKECIKYDLIFEDKNLSIKAYGFPSLNALDSLIDISEKVSSAIKSGALQDIAELPKNHLQYMHESIPRSLVNMLFSKLVYWIVIAPGLIFLALYFYSESTTSKLLCTVVLVLVLFTMLRSIFSRYFILLFAKLYSRR